MRKSALICVVFLCLIPVSCTVWGGKEKKGLEGATGGEHLQRAFLDAIKNKQWNDVQQRLSANFVLVTPNGVFDRAATMERIRQLDLKGYTLADMNVLPQGYDVVLTYTIDIDGMIAGKPVPPGPQRVVSTWQDVKGTWILISQVNVGNR